MISQDDFQKMTFETHGFIEPTKEKSTARLPIGYEFQNPRGRELRDAISNIVHDVKDSRKGTTITELITKSCNTSMATYKQYISGKGYPTRPFIAKLCVGLRLTVDQANALFRLHSGELNQTNDADCITYYALLTHNTIDEYEEELKIFLGR